MDTQNGKPVSFSAIDDHTEVIMPGDMNTKNTMYGGLIMFIGDKLAASVAKHHNGKDCVTVYARQRFLAPGRLGEILRFQLSVNRAWSTTSEIGMKVYADDLLTGERRHIVTAYFTFQTEDKSSARPVISETDEEKRRFAEADIRRANQRAEEAKQKKAKA